MLLRPEEQLVLALIRPDGSLPRGNNWLQLAVVGLGILRLLRDGAMQLEPSNGHLALWEANEPVLVVTKEPPSTALGRKISEAVCQDFAVASPSFWIGRLTVDHGVVEEVLESLNSRGILEEGPSQRLGFRKTRRWRVVKGDLRAEFRRKLLVAIESPGEPDAHVADTLAIGFASNVFRLLVSEEPRLTLKTQIGDGYTNDDLVRVVAQSVAANVVEDDRTTFVGVLTTMLSVLLRPLL